MLLQSFWRIVILGTFSGLQGICIFAKLEFKEKKASYNRKLKGRELHFFYFWSYWPEILPTRLICDEEIDFLILEVWHPGNAPMGGVAHHRGVLRIMHVAYQMKGLFKRITIIQSLGAWHLSNAPWAEWNLNFCNNGIY